MRITGLVGAVLAGLALAGCQGTASPYSRAMQGRIDQSLEQAKAANARPQVPSAVSQALLPPIQIPLPQGGSAPLERHFDISVNNAPARQVFMNLVEGTPYSIVLAPDVDGRISLSLKDTTVPEALEAIRRVYGYDYDRSGNQFYIYGRGMQTRIFPVNYLDLVRKGDSDTRVSSGELTNGTTGSTGQVTSTPNVRAGIDVKTTSDQDFWKTLQTTLTQLIGDKDGRRVVVNPQAGVVIVRAMPNELRVVRDFLHLTTASVNRQVILEAKILEVNLNHEFESGINWSKLATANGTNITASQVGGGSIFSGSGTSNIAGQQFTLNPASGQFTPTPGTLTSAFGGIFTLALQSSNFAAFVELLKTQGQVHVLSSPRVSTVNNQKAVIKVGGDQFFITQVSNTAVATGTTTTFIPSVQLTPFFSGIALDVTPDIDAHGNVILQIHPQVSQVTQQNQQFEVSGQAFNLPLASSTIQESDNIVRAHSGQVIVIGGLMKEGVTDDNASVPFLGDIPLIGNLFQHKKIVRIKTELVILLKPTVVNVDQDWSNAIGDYQKRVNRMQSGGY